MQTRNCSPHNQNEIWQLSGGRMEIKAHYQIFCWDLEENARNDAAEEKFVRTL